MGIDFTGVTAIHYAEQQAGRTLFRAGANIQGKNNSKQVVEVSIGSCSDGFNSLRATLLSFEQKQLVGNSKWSSFEFNNFINVCKQKIITTP